MEVFHLLHLAAIWRPQALAIAAQPAQLTTTSISPETPSPPATDPQSDASRSQGSSQPMIRAAAALLVFANRTTQEYIAPQLVLELEKWSGRAILETLCAVVITEEVRFFLARKMIRRVNCQF